ncbi:MAG: hypothetical protein SGI92_28740 [Bryobacteraceae bacterium]|nr:hypothetical protein [Bryobacteraceae bacterium]
MLTPAAVLPPSRAVDSDVRDLLADARRVDDDDPCEFDQQPLEEAESRRDAWDSGLSSIERWLCITERLQCLSREVLLTHGHQEWARFGGTKGIDGRPTFGRLSLPAVEILAEVAAEPGYFTYLDRTGWVRAVFITGEVTEGVAQWQGLSLGGAHAGFIFSRAARRAAAGPRRSVLVPVGGDSFAFRSADRAYDKARSTFAAKRAEVFELASRLAPLIWQAADRQQSLRLRLEMNDLPDALWCSSPLGWPSDWQDIVLGGLEEIAALSIQSVSLFKCGWHTRIVSSRPTILNWRLKARHELKLHLSPEFRQFGTRWDAMLAGPSRSYEVGRPSWRK